MYVLSDRQLSSTAEWQAAIDAEGYPLKLKNVDFERISGFLPAQLNGSPTGFECYHDLVDELIREADELRFDHAWKFLLSFRWRGDYDELQAAMMAGTAYAVATNGIMLDDESGSFLTPIEAREQVRKIVLGKAKFEAKMREFHSRLPQLVEEFKARRSDKP
jgi:hypothetical protein